MSGEKKKKEKKKKKKKEEEEIYGKKSFGILKIRRYYNIKNELGKT